MLILVANSTALNASTVTSPSCAGGAATRLSHLKCALTSVFNNYAGLVHFGVMTESYSLSACNAGCTTCTAVPFPNATSTGCGAVVAGTRQGGNVLVPITQDAYWSTPPTTSNVAQLLATVDNDCTSNNEIQIPPTATGNGLAGLLNDAGTYLSSGWASTTASFPSPWNAANDRACRKIHVVLITAGNESCDTVTTAAVAATALQAGKPGMPSVPVSVIDMATTSDANPIAAAGGTASALTGQTDLQLRLAFDAILQPLLPIETCNNADDDCNGCTDEGFGHFGDVQSTAGLACVDPMAACLTNFWASISAANPKGTTSLLPATTPAMATDAAQWLCFDPGEVCDNVDNNLNGQTDEGMAKCGSPAHCPAPEVCDGVDNNCNGVVDESVCPGGCVVQPEVCDGCDNDCDGIVDNGVTASTCGLTGPGEPQNCHGVLTCTAGGNVQPGSCGSGGKLKCTMQPQPEVCDGLDNDCDGIVDNGLASSPCLPGGVPFGLSYAANAQCKKGATQCIGGTTQCIGFVGPSAEQCDGIDNDCNGVVDNAVTGLGGTCGSSIGACATGKLACSGGALTCSGGKEPSAEVCDGIDNDCNGLTDDGTLADAPAPDKGGCWTVPGACCTFSSQATGKSVSWCPPPGATCDGSGSLTSPCSAGHLRCVGASGWTCDGAKGPSQEVCNGADDDCSGAADDGILAAPVGTQCGQGGGACQPGQWLCSAGNLTCTGTGPTLETCDGIDNDCDGVTDDLPFAPASCVPTYDAMLFPGDRSKGQCHTGVLACSGCGGEVCVGGIVPVAEICDGVDNDCDGLTDETGTAPDGIDGSAPPWGPAGAAIGTSCGVTQGACTAGIWTCTSGAFVCAGETAPRPEQCDGVDNDCNGATDDPPSGSSLCPSATFCARHGAITRCAAACAGPPWPCATGQSCVSAFDSQTSAPSADRCLPTSLIGGAP